MVDQSSAAMARALAAAAETLQGRETQIDAQQIETAVAALRSLKNAMIGNRTRKTALLQAGVAPAVLQVLRTALARGNLEQLSALQIEGAVVLGSFAVGAPLEALVPVLQEDPLSLLLALLAQSQTQAGTAVGAQLLETGARSLKALLAALLSDMPLDQSFGSISQAIVASYTAFTTFGGMAVALRDAGGKARTCADVIFNTPHIATLVSLLKLAPAGGAATPTGQHIERATELAAACLARVVSTREFQNVACAAGALPALVALLRAPAPATTQLAALECLAALTRENAEVCQALLGAEAPTAVLDVLLRFLQSHDGRIRLAAATCLVNQIRNKALPDATHASTVKLVLPSLVKLIGEPLDASRCSLAPLVLAMLIADEDALQKAAMEGDAIPKLAALIVGGGVEEIKRAVVAGSNAAVAPVRPAVTPQAAAPMDTDDGARTGRPLAKSQPANDQAVKVPGILEQRDWFDVEQVPAEKARAAPVPATTPVATPAPGTPQEREHVHEAALLAIGAICAFREECRKQVIDAQLLPAITAALSSRKVAVRAAACLCIRSLSRSVKHLRTSLVDAGVAEPLFGLLSDPSLQVQVTVSATLCNLVLDFSPMKRSLISSGGVEKLVALVHCADGNLRLNAVWGLKNLLFQADSAIKARVMQLLGYETLAQLANDARPEIQEQALNLVRNLACGSEGDIEAVFAGLGPARLMDLLEQKLLVMSHSDDVVLQALYALVNIATGTEAHKATLMRRSAILECIQRAMFSPNAKIRVASIWIVINLTWIDDAGTAARIARLCELGFDRELPALLNDPCLDVKERAKTAIEHFHLTVPGAPAAAMAVDASPPAGDRPSAVPTSAGASPLSGSGSIISP